MKKKIVSCFLCVVLLASSLAGLFPVSAAEDIYSLFDAKVFTASDGLKLNYRIYLPKDYSKDKEYPLVLFMHGAGERGSDNKTQLMGIQHSFNNSNSRIYDCIVIAPQCPLDKKWVNVSTWYDCNYSTDAIPETPHVKAVVELFEETKKAYSVDLDRVYGTGLSMGGFATWDMAIRHPDMFAAIIPLCGGADNRKAALIADLPVWTFHSTDDPTVPHTGTVNMVNSLKAAGNTKVKYTELTNLGHNVWSYAYSNEAIYMWLLTHKLSNRPSVKKDEPTPPATEESTTAATLPATTPVPTPTGTATTAAPVAQEGCKSRIGSLLPALLILSAGLWMLAGKKQKKQ